MSTDLEPSRALTEHISRHVKSGEPSPLVRLPRQAKRTKQIRNEKSLVRVSPLLIVLGCAAIPLITPIPATAQENATTSRYDNQRTSVNSHESILTPATVNSTNFGKLFSQSVDGYVYAQPLYVSNLTIGGVAHNVV
jgi:hypothetical protein